MASGRGPSGGISLRHESRPGDVAELVRLHRELYASEHGFDATFARYVERYLREFVAGGSGRIWIAEREREALGCIAIVDASSKRAQLRWFLVRPEARRGGLGRRLIDEALAFCEERGHEEVFLWTVARLEPAARLYRAVGFELAEQKPPARRWGVDVVEQLYVRAAAPRRVTI